MHFLSYYPDHPPSNLYPAPYSPVLVTGSDLKPQAFARTRPNSLGQPLMQPLDLAGRTSGNIRP